MNKTTNNEPHELPTYYQNFIALSRYSRWLEEENRRETWPETVDRYLDFMDKQAGKTDLGALPVETKKELREAIIHLDVMPSMRAMMTAGPALERDNTAGFNCSYLPVDSPRAFDEAMFILMCGTGVGFSVERQYVNKLPEVPDVIEKTKDVIVVQDSKEEWAKSVRKLISFLYTGAIPQIDVSNVRPAGARLKTFGGRASGPAPLVDLFNFTIEIFKGARGRKLNSIECHDLMCKIGEVVVVGGVRRSAMISLSNLSDERMRYAKSGQWWENNGQRALANNSVAYTEKPDSETFLREWCSLVESKSGERGIFNRVAARRQVEKYGRRKPDYEWGTNPCCVSGETPILTSQGYKQIDSVIDTPIRIWNGEDWASVTPFAAGEGQLYRVRLSDGSHLDCTTNHRWCVEGRFVQTNALMAGDKLDKFDMPVVEGVAHEDISKAYSQGFYAGDGNKDYSFSWVYEPKYAVAEALVGSVKEDIVGRKRWDHGKMLAKGFVPINDSLEYRLQWLAGLLDADGTVTRDANGSGFQIASIDHDFLDRLRLMLTTMGVRAKVVSGNAAGMRSMPDGRGGNKEYKCQETRRLLVGNFDSWRLMDMGLGTYLRRIEHNGKAPQRDARQFVRVTAVEPLNRVEMTYCFTEPKTSRGTFNGIVTGNSEIILRPNQMCNLSEVVVRSTDTEADLMRKVRLATILGTLQSTLTNFPYLRKQWKTTTEEERLLGVSFTGIMDNSMMNLPGPKLEGLLQKLRTYAVDVNAEWADMLGIQKSTAITCIKPSGTVSQLVNSASGIHARHSEYYIRTVRGDNKDPLTQFMKDAGIPHEPCVMKPDTTTVFSFPQKAPHGAVTRNDMSAVEQLELWLTYQRFWCEHKPSITVTVRPDEWVGVGAFVYEHFDEMSGVSFLPHSDHTYQQAPYQECDKDTYMAMLDQMPLGVDWYNLSDYEKEDNTKSSQTFACTAGECEIVDV